MVYLRRTSEMSSGQVIPDLLRALNASSEEKVDFLIEQLIIENGF